LEERPGNYTARGAESFGARFRSRAPRAAC
jgi:hypothetical protein